MIGVLTTSYPRAPADHAGRFVAELCHSWADAGERLEVIAPFPARSEHPRVVIQAVGQRTRHRWRLLYGDGALENLARARYARRAAAAIEIAPFTAGMGLRAARAKGRWRGVVSHWMVPGGLIAATVAPQLPHLLIAHGSDVHLLARLPGRRLMLDALARSRCRLVLTSEPLRAVLEGFAATRGARELIARAPVIPMGVTLRDPPPRARSELRRRLGLRPDRPVVLFIGRLIRLKGAELLLRACRGLDVQLVIVGDGPERAPLHELAAQLAVQARFTGWQLGEDKHRWLAASDLLAAPARVLPDGRSDSAPVTVLEAMAAGLPVVASRCGGTAALIDREGGGVLFAPGDVGALRAALCELFDPQYRRTIGRRARQVAEAHSWTKVAPQLHALLDEL